MKHLILFLLLSLSVVSYAQDCNYAVDKNGMLETQSEAIACNPDLSGIMATAKRDGDFKYFELFMFLSKKYSFDRGNEILLELEDGTTAIGIFSQDGTAIYSEAVGYYALKINVNFIQESYKDLSEKAIKKIKMRANSKDIEMMPVGDSSRFMKIVKCIL